MFSYYSLSFAYVNQLHNIDFVLFAFANACKNMGEYFILILSIIFKCIIRRTLLISILTFISLFDYQVDLRHMCEVENSNIVPLGIDLSEFYMSVEWDILEVPAVRYVNHNLFIISFQLINVLFSLPQCIFSHTNIMKAFLAKIEI